METRSGPAQPFAAGLGADAASLLLQLEVEQLLYLEARLLDDWSLDAWLALYTPDARYVVPTTDLPEGDPRSDLVFHRPTTTATGWQPGSSGCRAATPTASTPGRGPAGSSPTSW